MIIGRWQGPCRKAHLFCLTTPRHPYHRKFHPQHKQIKYAPESRPAALQGESPLRSGSHVRCQSATRMRSSARTRPAWHLAYLSTLRDGADGAGLPALHGARDGPRPSPRDDERVSPRTLQQGAASGGVSCAEPVACATATAPPGFAPRGVLTEPSSHAGGPACLRPGASVSECPPVRRYVPGRFLRSEP